MGAMEEERKLKMRKGVRLKDRKGGREREYVWKMEKVSKIKKGERSLEKGRNGERVEN